MSENFFEKFKKYGIWIAWLAIISIIVYFVKPDDLYWRKDISDNENLLIIPISILL